MKNTFKLKAICKTAGIIALLAVIGFSFVACGGGDDGGGSSDSNVDPALNGRWVDKYLNENKFDNGSFEISEVRTPPMIPAMFKGTYTTSRNIITMTRTHLYGSYFGLGLESKWYSLADLKAALSGEDLKSLERNFTPWTGSYSIKGNILTLGSETFTKRN